MNTGLFEFGLGVALGGVAVWYGKDTLTKWVIGTESFVKNLEAKTTYYKAKLGLK